MSKTQKRPVAFCCNSKRDPSKLSAPNLTPFLTPIQQSQPQYSICSFCCSQQSFCFLIELTPLAKRSGSGCWLPRSERAPLPSSSLYPSINAPLAHTLTHIKTLTWRRVWSKTGRRTSRSQKVHFYTTFHAVECV